MKITYEQAKLINSLYYSFEQRDTGIVDDMLEAVNSVLADIPETPQEITWLPRPTSDEGFKGGQLIIGRINGGNQILLQRGIPSAWTGNVTHYIPWTQDPISQDEQEFLVWFSRSGIGLGAQDVAKQAWKAARTPKA